MHFEDEADWLCSEEKNMPYGAIPPRDACFFLNKDSFRKFAVFPDCILLFTQVEPYRKILILIMKRY